MPKIFTSLCLPLLALVMSFTLTSCFEHCKKDDPKPKCGTSTAPTTKTPTGGVS